MQRGGTGRSNGGNVLCCEYVRETDGTRDNGETMCALTLSPSGHLAYLPRGCRAVNMLRETDAVNTLPRRRNRRRRCALG
eukprot:5762196-Prymnesium_polylepis.1